MRFRDRADAGHRLAAKLEPYRQERPIVLALPRGGVLVAFEVACALGAPLDVLMLRGFRFGEASAIAGTVGEGGGVYLDPAALRELGLRDRDAAALAAAQTPDLLNRLRAYHAERPPPRLAGRTVILVDDGVATGATARAAAWAAWKRHAAKVVLAVPVIAGSAVAELTPEVDELVVLELPPELASISDWYERFEEVSDAEAVACLRRATAARVPAVEESDPWNGEWIGAERRAPPPAEDEAPSPCPASAQAPDAPARHTFEEHTGELALRMEAPTLRSLFQQAGKALSEAMGGASRSLADKEVKVVVAAPDREALLVEWLNELVYRAEVDHMLPSEFRVERLSERELEAVVRGPRLEHLRNPVKAATYHGLSVVEGPEGWRATIVLDV
jgi:putative phosphoribosyl transferase